MTAQDACAAGFVAVYAFDALPHQTQYLGLALGLSFAFLAAAAIALGMLLVPQEEVAEHLRRERSPIGLQPEEDNVAAVERLAHIDLFAAGCRVEKMPDI